MYFQKEDLAVFVFPYFSVYLSIYFSYYYYYSAKEVAFLVASVSLLVSWVTVINRFL